MSVGTIPPGVLSDILRRLDALEQQRTGTDETLSPSYLTIDPTTGNVSALFTGGLLLNEAPAFASGVTSSSVSWKDATSIREFIEGVLVSPGVHAIGMVSQPVPPAGLDFANLIAQATQGGASGSALIRMVLSDSAGGSQTRTILNSAGRSNFVQTGGSSVLSAIGTDTITWPAASASSNILTVTLPGASGTVQGLATPRGFIMNPGVFDAGIMVLATPAGGGQIQFQAYSQNRGAPGAAGTMSFSYLIWGT